MCRRGLLPSSLLPSTRVLPPLSSPSSPDRSLLKFTPPSFLLPSCRCLPEGPQLTGGLRSPSPSHFQEALPEEKGVGGSSSGAVVLMLGLLLTQRDERLRTDAEQKIFSSFTFSLSLFLSLFCTNHRRSQLLLRHGKRTDSWRGVGGANERAESRWIEERERMKEGDCVV